MSTHTFWQATAPTLPDLGEGSPAASCDVVVIGAGLTGFSAALHLARAGRSVQVLERDRVGSGASMRNGGMTLTGLKLSPTARSNAMARFGPHTAPVTTARLPLPRNF